MKKTCNYCKAYEPGLGKGDYGNCLLHFPQEKLNRDELKKYNVWPYGLKEARYYIAMKPIAECDAPKTWKELYDAGWGVD